MIVQKLRLHNCKRCYTIAQLQDMLQAMIVYLIDLVFKLVVEISEKVVS